jgi:hypothetical protein
LAKGKDVAGFREPTTRRLPRARGAEAAAMSRCVTCHSSERLDTQAGSTECQRLNGELVEIRDRLITAEDSRAF